MAANLFEINTIEQKQKFKKTITEIYLTYNAIAINPFNGMIPHTTPIKIPITCLDQ